MSRAYAPRRVPTAIAVAFLVALIAFFTHSNWRLAAAQGSSLAIDGRQTYQTIDGMGVNAMSIGYKNGELLPALDLLTRDLGSGLWRVVIECDQDCEDANDDPDPFHFNWTYYSALYETARFQALWGVLRYLQDKPGRIVINVTARAPAWMGGSSITADDEWVEMIVSLAYYARVFKGLRFEMLSPMNGPDGAGNDGPIVSAAQAARLMRQIADRLSALGLSDLTLVPPETTNPDIALSTYIPAMVGDAVLMGQIDHYGVHSYDGQSGGLDAYIKNSPYPSKTFWVTEFADTCYVGCDHGMPVPDEWNFAKNTVLNLFAHVRDGATGLIVYEGYDAWRDRHGGVGTTGLLAYDSGTGTYTPRLRYHAVKQAIRFVPPGSTRIDASSPDANLNVLAFFHPASGRVTIVGYNASNAPVTLNVTLNGLPDVSSFELYQTSSLASFQRGPNVTVSGGRFSAQVSASALFTLTTMAPDTSPAPAGAENPSDASSSADRAVVTRGASGGAERLVVSTTDAVVSVPDVVGLTQQAATTAIAGAGLVVGTVSNAASATTAAGSVISEDPAGGTEVASDSAVNLVVSTGIAGAPIVIGNQIAGTFADATGHSMQSHLVYAANAGVWWLFTLTSIADSQGGTNHIVKAYRSSGSTLATATWTAAADSPGASTLSSSSCSACSMGGGRALGVAYINNAPTDVVHAEVALATNGQNGLTGHIRAAVTATSITWGSWNYHDEPAATWTLPRAVGLGVSSGKYIHSGGPTLQQEVDANARRSNTPDTSATWTDGFSTVAVIDNSMIHESNAIAFAPLANNAMLAVYDNGGGVSTCYNCGQTGVPEPNLTNLGYKKSNPDGSWPPVPVGSQGGGDGQVFSTSATIDQNDWALVSVGTTGIYAFRGNAAGTGIDAAAYNTAGNTWSNFSAPPLFGSGQSLKQGAGVFGTTAASNIWLFVINTDAANSILYTRYNGTTWTAWASLPGTDSGLHIRKFISGYPATGANQIGLIWTEGTTQNDVVAIAVATDVPPAVPDVVNQTQAAATIAITGAGLLVGGVTNTSSATVPDGSVVSQNPVGGTEVATGSAVNLVVSTGPPLVSVPNVVNLTQAAATTAITGSGLTVGAVSTATSTTVPAGSVISQNPVAGTQIALGSAVSLVVSSGAVQQVAVPSVVGLTQAAATAALTNTNLAVGAVTTASSTTIPAGSVISQNPVAGTQVVLGSAVSLVVSSGPPPPPVALAVDKVVFSDGAGTRVTPSFSTAAAGELLVAFGSSDGPQNSTKQTLTVSGAGLAWTLVRRGNTQFGTAEIWTATAPTPLANVAVTATQALTGYNQSLTVVTFVGAGGTGATAAASAATGPSSVSLTTTRAGSLVYGVGNDSVRPVARTLGPNQTMVHQWFVTTSTQAFWVQARTTAVATAGTVATINDTGPTSGRWNLSAVEILTPPPLIGVPNVVGSTQAAATSVIVNAGLVVGTVTNASSATVPAGSVISQNPISGTQVASGSAVNLVVSTGPSLVAVPNVVDSTQAAATTAITNAGLVVGTVTNASSATVPAGSVISQNPVGGTQVATGSAVNLVVSTGPPLIAVPNVVNATQAAATTAITNAGLVVGTVTNASSATVPAGSVISQNPVAATQVATGSAVNLVVSAELALIAVPNVVDSTQAAATTAITNAGLVVGTITNASSATVPAGSVISQNPVGGTQVATGSAVNLVVSTGPPLIAVPNVVNATQAAATTAITNAGLVVGTVTNASSATVPAGSVISQNPVAATQVATGSAVNLVVSAELALIAVPNVVDSTQAAATTAITNAGLVVGTITNASSATVPAGSVISQNPVGGTQVATGSAVNLVVSTGPPLIPVPNVVNSTQAAATTAINGAGLVVGTVTNASSATVPAGSVISQNPISGTQVASGSAVNLVVSTGPSLVAVPNVVDSTQAAATTAITNAGLVVGTITNASSVTVPAGSVISQNPVGGTQVATGSAVNLVVSTGPSLVAVPNVVNATQAAATTAITNAGLVVGTVTNASSATVPAGSVISQNPLGGTQVATGSAVNLVVSTGPSLVAVPNVVNATQAAATTAITNAGLVVGTITNASSATVPAGSVISQNPLGGTQVATGSAVNLVVSTGPPLTSVPNVVNSTQAAATTAINGAGLVVGTVTNASSATVPAGSVISQNPVGGTQVASGSAVSLVVSTGPPPASPTVDTVVFSDGAGTRNTPAFNTTAAGEVLLAFVASDGPSTGPQTLTVSGAGLTWTLVRRSNAMAGTSEIWRASAAARLTNVTVRSSQSVGSYRQSLTVVAFRGATGTGASAIASGATGAPSVTLVTTRANALVYGVGNDWDRAVARTLGAGQLMVHQRLETAAGDTFWVQSRNAAVPTAGSSIELNDTAPTNDRWNFASVEIVP